MRHRRSGKKLGRDSAHRKALYSNLVAALFEHGRIKTTEAKAKAVRPIAEELILSPQTVKNHVRHIYGKLEVETRVEAVLYAIDNGIVSNE